MSCLTGRAYLRQRLDLADAPFYGEYTYHTLRSHRSQGTYAKCYSGVLLLQYHERLGSYNTASI